MGRVVCKLLSTQFLGAELLIKFDLYSRAINSFRYYKSKVS